MTIYAKAAFKFLTQHYSKPARAREKPAMKILSEASCEEIREMFRSNKFPCELDNEEKWAVATYVGICELVGRFVHPSELICQKSEYFTYQAFLLLILALQKLGYEVSAPLFAGFTFRHRVFPVVLTDQRKKTE